MQRGGFVYLMASCRNGTLYLGVTSDLARRVGQHRAGEIAGFTKDYGIKRLVWFEHFDDIRTAIHRETQMKGWRRAWKLRAIQEHNLNWRDLALDLGFEPLADDSTATGERPTIDNRMAVSA